MIALFGLILILQGIFYWLFTPIIKFTTPFFEARLLAVLSFVIIAWVISGRTQDKSSV